MAFLVVSLCWEPKGRTVPSDGRLLGGRKQLSQEGFNGCNENENKGIATDPAQRGQDAEPQSLKAPCEKASSTCAPVHSNTLALLCRDTSLSLPL